jgi:hypothetical protein
VIWVDHASHVSLSFTPVGIIQSLMGAKEEDLSNLYTSLPIPFSKKYPDVPPPDPPRSLYLIVARWQSHDLYGEDMAQVAADLLEAGHNTPMLRRLAGEISIGSSADVEPLVARVFQELGLRYPISQTEAKLIVSRQIAREVIAGMRNAWAAATHLEIAIWGWQAPTPALQNIFDINDEIDWEPKYRRSLENLRDSLLVSLVSLARLKDDEIVS